MKCFAQGHDLHTDGKARGALLSRRPTKLFIAFKSIINITCFYLIIFVIKLHNFSLIMITFVYLFSMDVGHV